MKQLKVTITGPRGSGKTTLINFIKRQLADADVDTQQNICESMDSENITVHLSRNDLAALRTRST